MGSTAATTFLTSTAMILIAALAVAAVAAILFGRRQKMRRLAGEREIVERREAAGLPATSTDTPDATEPVKTKAAAKPAVKAVRKPAAKAAAKPAAKAKATPAAKPVAAPAKASPAAKPAAAPAKAPKAAAPKPAAAPKAKTTTPKAKPAAAPKAKPAAAPKAKPAAAPKPKPAAAPKPKPVAVAPSPPPVADTPVVATPAAAASAITGEITQMKGLGPKLAATLAELGYTRVDQIAALTPTQADTLDAQLGAFQGRIARDKWIEQAKLLTAGDQAVYEAAFGKLG